MKEISMNRKEFIQTYLTQLDKEINDAKKARKVLDALIEANKGYWPELK